MNAGRGVPDTDPHHELKKPELKEIWIYIWKY
jgi:hypothetical protein